MDKQPSSQTHKSERVMHPLKFRLLQVKQINHSSPLMKRITLTGEDLADFVSASPDDHVKVFFPKPGEEKPIVPKAGPNGPEIGDGENRPIMRDFTPVRFDNAAKELELEFFLHDQGDATTWAKQAQVGQYLGVGGPRGSLVVSYDFDWYLLVGDEAALPSFTRRLLELPAGSKALVFVEVSSSEEIRKFQSPAEIDVHWIVRSREEAGSSDLFKKTILKSTFPHGDYYTWIATELQCSKDLKELLETVRGANPEWIKATGYWKKN
jgi:NADPH-dependent ferric siderophore reductase